MSGAITTKADANSNADGGDGQPDALLGLHPNHLRDLRSSGLSDETIRASGIYSETRYNKLAELLGWRRYPKRCAPAWVVPYRTPEGRETGYARIKPDNPRVAKNKPVKYESPRNRDNDVYFPPGIGGTIDNAAAELLIAGGRRRLLVATDAALLLAGEPRLRFRIERAQADWLARVSGIALARRSRLHRNAAGVDGVSAW